jgi:hypothetical protein
MAMASQKFDPKIFINDVQGLCGILDPLTLLLADNFAVNIGDQSKLNQCLKHTRKLVNGLPREAIWLIFFWIFTTYVYFHEMKHIKPVQARIKRSHAKKKARYLKEIKEAIELVKALNPDPSKFDEGYLLNLAEEKAAEKKFAPQTRDEKLTHLIELVESSDVEIGKSILKKKNPKGYNAVNIFIYAVHKTVKNPGLTDNEIYERLASLLAIMTGEAYSRQRVQGFFRRKPKTPEIPTSAK